MATRLRPDLGPKRDVVRVEAEGRRRYALLECSHRILISVRHNGRWGFCPECPNADH